MNVTQRLKSWRVRGEQLMKPADHVDLRPMITLISKLRWGGLVLGPCAARKLGWTHRWCVVARWSATKPAIRRWDGRV